MDTLGGLVWPLRGCDGKLDMPFETKSVFVGMNYVKKNGQMEVSFNLTERFPVLTNGLVSLLDSTLTLFSSGQTDGCSWWLRGEGKETILG